MKKNENIKRLIKEGKMFYVRVKEYDVLGEYMNDSVSIMYLKKEYFNQIINELLQLKLYHINISYQADKVIIDFSLKGYNNIFQLTKF